MQTIELDFPTKQDLCDEVDRLAAQVKRLTVALEHIIECSVKDKFRPDPYSEAISDHFSDIAQKALKDIVPRMKHAK